MPTGQIPLFASSFSHPIKTNTTIIKFHDSRRASCKENVNDDTSQSCTHANTHTLSDRCLVGLWAAGVILNGVNHTCKLQSRGHLPFMETLIAPLNTCQMFTPLKARSRAERSVKFRTIRFKILCTDCQFSSVTIQHIHSQHRKTFSIHQHSPKHTNNTFFIQHLQ